MHPKLIFMLHEILAVLECAGPTGVSEDSLLNQMRYQVDFLPTTSEETMILNKLLSKRWAITYRDQFTDTVRYVLTDAGRIAKESL